MIRINVLEDALHGILLYVIDLHKLILTTVSKYAWHLRDLFKSIVGAQHGFKIA